MIYDTTKQVCLAGAQSYITIVVHGVFTTQGNWLPLQSRSVVLLVMLLVKYISHWEHKCSTMLTFFLKKMRNKHVCEIYFEGNTGHMTVDVNIL